MAGQDVPPDIADHDLVAMLRLELTPFLERGDVMRPDFGAFGDLRVEGSLLQVADPVRATLEFDDHCVRQTARGMLIPSRRRRVRIAMHVMIEPIRVVDCTVSEVVERGA
jgi:hypothetical protein